MDLKNVNTVNELIDFNQQESTADEIMDKCLEAGIITGHEVCTRLVGAAIDFHKKRLAEYATDDEVDSCAVILWTKDLTNLQIAMNLLQQIDLGQEEE